MEAFEPKWVNPILKIFGVNPRLAGLHMCVLTYFNSWIWKNLNVFFLFFFKLWINYIKISIIDISFLTIIYFPFWCYHINTVENNNFEVLKQLRNHSSFKRIEYNLIFLLTKKHTADRNQINPIFLKIKQIRHSLREIKKCISAYEIRNVFWKFTKWYENVRIMALIKGYSTQSLYDLYSPYTSNA